MNYKMIAMKLSMPLMLAGVMLGNGAYAEENKYFEFVQESTWNDGKTINNWGQSQLKSRVY